ncbi:MAG: ComEC/Rec2 family competence protein [Kiritimatiellia bacterium]
MRRPLLGIAAAVLAGSLIGLALRPSPTSLLAGLLILLLAISLGVFRKGTRASPLLLTVGVWMLAGGLAVLAASLAASPVSPADIRQWLPREKDTRIKVIGRVTGDPVAIQNTNAYSVRFPLNAESLQLSTSAPPRSVRGSVMVTWVKPRFVPLPAYGERWEVSGFVSSLDPAQLRAGPYGPRFVARYKGNAFRQFCERRRVQALRILSAGLKGHPEELGLLQALMLGTRLRLPAELKRDFMATGTFHIMAISGLHVGMIAWLLAAFLRIFGISRVWWFPILAPLLIVYTMGTGASSSALRACIMSCLFFAATLFERRDDSPSALAGAAVLIVALDPFQVLDRGFILSFCLVGGLIVVAPLLRGATPAFLHADPFLADELVPGWKKTGFAFGRAAWSSGTLSAAAWLTSLPLSAYYFKSVSLSAIVGNLVAVPLSFLIVLTGSLSLILGSVWLFLAELLNYANLVLIQLLMGFLGALARLPYASVAVTQPPAWIVPAWYVVLLILAFWLHERNRRNEPEQTF